MMDGADVEAHIKGIVVPQDEVPTDYPPINLCNFVTGPHQFGAGERFLCLVANHFGFGA